MKYKYKEDFDSIFHHLKLLSEYTGEQKPEVVSFINQISFRLKSIIENLKDEQKTLEDCINEFKKSN